MAKNPNIDDDTRKRARAFVAAKTEPRAIAAEDDATKRLPKKKPRVVSKKELEESGLSLRDFLNRERGLTRRPDKSDSKVEAAKKQIMSGGKPSDDEIEKAKKQIMRGGKPTDEEIEKAKKQLGFAKGGMVNCGASVPPAQKRK